MTILSSDYPRMCADYPRISSDVFGLSSNRLYIGGNTSGMPSGKLDLRISWQVQYLVRLQGDKGCSAHCKRRFICEADQS